MTTRFALRALRALDLDLAASLHREAFTPLGERAWTRQELAELLASHGVKGFVFATESNAIGFALMRVAADEAELLTLAVHPGHRRRGAGRALLDAVIGASRSLAARTLFLEVGADNDAARALYDRAGFEIVGRRQGYYRRSAAAPADAIVMRLALT